MRWNLDCLISKGHPHSLILPGTFYLTVKLGWINTANRLNKPHRCFLSTLDKWEIDKAIQLSWVADFDMLVSVKQTVRNYTQKLSICWNIETSLKQNVKASQLNIANETWYLKYYHNLSSCLLLSFVVACSFFQLKFCKKKNNGFIIFAILKLYGFLKQHWSQCQVSFQHSLKCLST